VDSICLSVANLWLLVFVSQFSSSLDSFIQSLPCLSTSVMSDDDIINNEPVLQTLPYRTPNATFYWGRSRTLLQQLH
jgi:hypothetical protein